MKKKRLARLSTTTKTLTYHFGVPNESIWTIPDDKVDAAARTAGELARMAEHQGGSRLPNLSNPTSELEKSIVKRLADWLESLFRPSNSLSKINLEFLLFFLKWLGIALIVIGLGYLLYLLLTRGRRRGPAANEVGRPAPTLSTDALEIDLQDALSRGQLARATRLRWRIFLVRNEKNPDLTPYEFFRAQKATLGAWLEKQYRVMFSGAVVTRPDYDEIDGRLTSIEAAGDDQRKARHGT